MDMRIAAAFAAPGAREVRETHISWVFLSEEEVRGNRSSLWSAGCRAPERARWRGSSAGGPGLGCSRRTSSASASPELRARRAATRVGDASDATAAVAAAQRFEPINAEHLVVRADRPVADLAGDAEEWLDQIASRL